MAAFAKVWRREQTMKKPTTKLSAQDRVIVTSDEIDRIHKVVFEFERTEAIFDSARVFEILWPVAVSPGGSGRLRCAPMASPVKAEGTQHAFNSICAPT
jgi:NACalpha-BTF3-like transcription factor